MYMEMLETAVAELKGEKIEPKTEPVIDLKIMAVITEEYIENPDLRLSIYRKIASAKDIKSLERLLEELKDRFGPPPEKTKRLLEIMELKILANKFLITRIQNITDRIQIIFAPDMPATSEKIFSLYNTRKKILKFLPEGGIELDFRGKPWSDIFKELKRVIGGTGKRRLCAFMTHWIGWCSKNNKRFLDYVLILNNFQLDLKVQRQYRYIFCLLSEYF